MPLKMQYPVMLHKDTKCPVCNTEIHPLGGNTYVCSAGHVIEGILLVTLPPKQKQEPVKVENEALTPGYDLKAVKQ